MNMIRNAAVALALMTSGAAYAGAPGWTISESTGSVIVARAGISKIAVRGGAVTAGDFVSTNANGRAVLVRGQEYLVVSPNSRIRIADPAASGGFTQIIQNFGNTLFRIKKKSTPHFAVETPYLAAVVKGTTFSVTVTDTGTAVQVTEGLVQVSTADGGATHLVRPGDIGIVDAAMPLRLKIEGRDAQVIDSPNQPSAKPAAPAEVATAATDAFAEEAKAAPAQSSASTEAVSVFDTVIGAPVSEGSVRLESVTGGLITGNPVALALADTKPRVEVLPRPAMPVVIDPPVPVPPVEVVDSLPAQTPASLPAQEPIVDPLPPIDLSQSPAVMVPSEPDAANPVEVVTVVTPPPALPPVTADTGNGQAPIEVVTVVTPPPALPPVIVDTGNGQAPIEVVTVVTPPPALPPVTVDTGNGQAPIEVVAVVTPPPALPPVTVDTGNGQAPIEVVTVVTPRLGLPVVIVGNGNNGHGNANGQSNGNNGHGNANGHNNRNNGHGNNGHGNNGNGNNGNHHGHGNDRGRDD